MAITVTDRGTDAFIGTAATTTTFAPASNFAAGSMAVCFVALNNSETDGVAYATLTLTDTNGNTWTRREMPLYDPGTTNEGITGAIFTSPMDGGTLTTGSTLTVTTSTGTTRRIAILWEVVPTAGYVINYVDSGVGTGSATTTPTVTTASITSGNVVIGGVLVERNTTITGDSDTTNGTWSTQQTNGGGNNDATGIGASSQYKVVTATATQSYDPTLANSADCVACWIQFGETATATYGWRSINGWWLGWTLSNPQTSSGQISATDSFAFSVSAAGSAQASTAASDSFAFTLSGAGSAQASVSAASSPAFTSSVSISATASTAATDSFAFTLTSAGSASASLSATDSFSFTVTSGAGAVAGISAVDSFAFTALVASSALAGISATDSFAFSASAVLLFVGQSFAGTPSEGWEFGYTETVWIFPAPVSVFSFGNH